jgi:hypothetical protein
MQEGDICKLKLSENLEDNLLKKIFERAKPKKGDAKTARLQSNVPDYDLLMQLMRTARAQVFKNRECPYLILYWPKKKRVGKTKDHFAEVTARRLITMFKESRELARFTGESQPSFYHLRSLANLLAKEAKCDLQSIKQA